MQMRMLGASGIEVSAIGLGCMSMSQSYGIPDEAEAEATLLRALDEGVTFFDTANAYGDGHNETLIGRVLAPHRDRMVLATKFGIIRAAVSVESYALAVAAMLAAVIAAFLYLRIMVSMWLSDPNDDAPVSISKSAGLAITLAVATTLLIGVLPGLLLDISQAISF